MKQADALIRHYIHRLYNTSGMSFLCFPNENLSKENWQQNITNEEIKAGTQLRPRKLLDHPHSYTRDAHYIIMRSNRMHYTIYTIAVIPKSNARLLSFSPER